MSQDTAFSNEPQVPTKFCIFCGAKIPNVAQYCEKCGGKAVTIEKPSTLVGQEEVAQLKPQSAIWQIGLPIVCVPIVIGIGGLVLCICGVGLGIVSSLFLGAIGLFWGHVFAQTRRRSEDEREWADYVRDFGVMSSYSAYFLAAIIVFFGVVFREERELPMVSKCFLNGGLIASALCIAFWPIVKPKPKTTDSKWVRRLWAWKILMLSACAGLTVGGILLAVMPYLEA